MKKLFAWILLAVICLNLGGCRFTIPAGTTETFPIVDPLGVPEIIVDENDIRWENRYDRNGEHIGYYQYVGGTNCGVPGTVRIDFLDINGKVLNSYSPTLAGCTIGGGCHGRWPHGQFEITNIGENVRGHQDPDKLIRNEYQVYPLSGGKIYSYIETRYGKTTKCELYDTKGNLIVDVKPLKPNHTLNIYNICVFFAEDWEGYRDHFQVYENNGEKNIREIFYGTDGAFLGDFRYKHTEKSYSFGASYARVELADREGNIKRLYIQSREDSWFSIGYDPRFSCFVISERSADGKMLFSERLALGTYETVFKEENIYENGVFSHMVMEMYGCEVKVTSVAREGRCTKLEFCDSQGNVKKTVQAPEGGWLSYRWVDYCEITTYDAQGQQVDWDTYHG